ncbi:MAG: hypothetical protein QOG04_1061 [Actinomycetota bacterium]|nr:hypothetical protein [Actinomycetota bacterium]
MARQDDSKPQKGLVTQIVRFQSWQFSPYVAGAELPSVSIVGVPVRAVGARLAVRLATAHGLQTVGDPLLALVLGCEVVSQSDEQAPDEDRYPSKVVPVEAPEIGIELPVETHLR